MSNTTCVDREWCSNRTDISSHRKLANICTFCHRWFRKPKLLLSSRSKQCLGKQYTYYPFAARVKGYLLGLFIHNFNSLLPVLTRINNIFQSNELSARKWPSFDPIEHSKLFREIITVNTLKSFSTVLDTAILYILGSMKPVLSEKAFYSTSYRVLS